RQGWHTSCAGARDAPARCREFACMWVLVVEDDVVIRDTIVQALAERGHDAVGTPDGSWALEYLQSIYHTGHRQPGLILLDLAMPYLDGWQFLREYRRLPVAHAPVIVLTAIPGAQQRAAEVQADRVVVKPFDL